MEVQLLQKFPDRWFVESLLKNRILKHEQLLELAQWYDHQELFSNFLVQQGVIPAADLVQYIERVFQIPFVNLENYPIDAHAIEIVPEDICQKYNLLPLSVEGHYLHVAFANPFDVQVERELRFLTGKYIRPYFAFREQLQQKIGEYYSPDKFINSIVNKAKVRHQIRIAGDDGSLDDAPVVKLVNLIISDAIEKEASDIHIEPTEHVVVVRFRIDGVLQKILEIPRNSHAALVSRIKIISNLNIAETRKPQDGKAKVYLDDVDIDLRVSVLPTTYGEKIVIRILDRRKALVSFDQLGLREENLEKLKQCFAFKDGMILVTGPTGSGKTTTLYAALNQIKSVANNILTIEDPIEYMLEGINQVQVNEKAGITFATALRSFLRQDPDVILVGEIRDRETAEIAVQAALTGHLVLSTLHTNNTLATITRLMDMGIESFKVADALQSIIAQRLVRRLCLECKEEGTSGDEEQWLPRLQSLGLKPRFYRAAGCAACNYTGYKGRIGVYEILILDQELKAAIAENRPLPELRKMAQEKGFRSLLDEALVLVAEGVTDLAEIKRVINVFEPEARTPVVSAAVAPAVEESLAEEKVVEEHPEAEPGTPRVLLVEDDRVMRMMIRKQIETRKEWEVLEAEDGREALDLVKKKRPDVIVLDIMMPRMDGFEFLKIIRSDLAYSTIPVIILTAMEGSENEIKGFELGADDYLVKPFHPDILLARIERFLKSKF
ncbi:MAG: type II/IV secretion system protein [Calditrichaeota bacterium]|nr:type II/IV secretion system protein [Calditrichota bacterium]